MHKAVQDADLELLNLNCSINRTIVELIHLLIIGYNKFKTDRMYRERFAFIVLIKRRRLKLLVIFMLNHIQSSQLFVNSIW